MGGGGLGGIRRRMGAKRRLVNGRRLGWVVGVGSRTGGWYRLLMLRGGCGGVEGRRVRELEGDGRDEEGFL